MRITLISLSTPTPFNSGAASALPYHLAKYRDEAVESEIYSFYINHIGKDMIEASEKALNAKIHCVPLPVWYTIMFKLHLCYLKYSFIVGIASIVSKSLLDKNAFMLGLLLNS